MSKKEKTKNGLAELAKKAFCKNRGFKNGPSKSYADLVIHEGGEDIFYEIKATSMTRQGYESITAKTKYFGAATLTEWNKAIKHPNRYRFVLVIMEKDTNEMLGYEEYSPKEILAYSTIPPFKVNINIPIQKPKKITPPDRKPGTVSATDSNENLFQRLSGLIDYYKGTLNGIICE